MLGPTQTVVLLRNKVISSPRIVLDGVADTVRRKHEILSAVLARSRGGITATSLLKEDNHV